MEFNPVDHKVNPPTGSPRRQYRLKINLEERESDQHDPTFLVLFPDHPVIRSKNKMEVTQRG